VVIAILDSGINRAHPDLSGRIVPGFNFVSGTTDTTDDFGHGTAVAGVALAAGNNSVGVAGVAFGCSILPVKVVNGSGFAYYSTIADGIHYAVDQGARVINISIAGSSPSITLQEAVDYAWSNNVIVVAAAGNNSTSDPQYPAACDHVVAVSATEPDVSGRTSVCQLRATTSGPRNAIWRIRTAPGVAPPSPAR
jgi:thermitase